MVKYDDASWHYGNDFPEGLPDEAGATHTGMFVAWALLSGLAGSLHLEEFQEELGALQRRAISPSSYYFKCCDGKFTDEDLNDEGNDFATSYYDFKIGQYLADYEALFAKGLPTIYHVEDSWENFDRLRPIIDQRFRDWKAQRAG